MSNFLEKYKNRIYYKGSERNPLALYGLSVGKGWYSLVDELADKLDSLDDRIRFFQVKEKMGGLRFYIEFIPKLNMDNQEDKNTYKMIHKLIVEYEKKCAMVCEKCGASGKLRTDLKWKKTVCDDHYSELSKR
jgi:hypothetical protein